MLSRTSTCAIAVFIFAGIGAGVLAVDASKTTAPDQDEFRKPRTRAVPTKASPPPTRIQVDAAVKRGLAWLAREQSPGGGWTGATGHKRRSGYVTFYDEEYQRARGLAHPGVTALAGLAFLADGHLPGRGRHAKVIDRIVDYLLDRTGRHAYITDSASRMYGHSFAVLFLAQIHGMITRREAEVFDKLRDSCRFVVDNQNEYGAWRYAPGMNQADLSVTVCQVQALRAARNAGVRVSKRAIDRVVEYVKKSRIRSGWAEGAFYYKIYGRSARTKTSYAVNAAAVTSLHSAGIFDAKLYKGALEYLEDHYDEVSQSYPDHYFFWYGNYYAAQALRLEGGKRWERYWAKVSRDLLRRQNPDGSWNNSVGPGRNFSTAVACLILRAPLGYLPIFRN